MTKPRVCVTLTAPTTAELRRKRDAVADADVIELRLDTVSDPDIAGALEGRSRPVIITCRPLWEGGCFKGSEDERRRILEDALAGGADYVDVEWRADFGSLLAETAGRRIVLSSHDFESMPGDLAARAGAMRATGAEVIKLAGKANRLSDCLPLLELARRMAGDGPLVLVAMGERGLASRILASRFGSAWTYTGSMSAVGQVTPDDLLCMYRFRSIGSSTAVYGVVGSPIAHSVSPAMHNAAFRAAALDAVYLPFDAADAGDFVGFAEALTLRGASVTIPFKTSLFERLDGVDPAARRIGAINTVRVADGRWHGSNTDVVGFLRPLQERQIPLQGLRASILGAGGSARAVAVALMSGGAKVTVHARDGSRASAVAAMSGGQAGPWPPEPRSWDLLVNCTPIGMHPRVGDTPVPAEALTGGLVYDLVYNPSATRLMREAAAAGCQTIGGLDMLVAQAHEQFREWTGLQPQPGVMRAAALQRLLEFSVDEHHIV